MHSGEFGLEVAEERAAESQMSQLEPETAGVEAAKGSAQKQLSKQLIGFGLALVFLWLSFKDANWAELLKQMQGLNPLWLLAVCVSGMLSHVLRAARWNLMLQPLRQEKIRLWNSFSALMIGYAVNVVIPRGGEVARLISLTRSEKLPWAGVLPTVLIDRLLDIAMLVFCLGGSIVFLPAKLKAEMPALDKLGVMLCVMTIAGLVMLPYAGRILKWLCAKPFVEQKLPEKVQMRLHEISAEFEQGTKSLTTPIGFPAIAGTTILIWFFYLLNFYFMGWAFHLQEKIDIANWLIIFAIGSIGVLLPTPGSVGSYHYSVSKAMTLTAGVDPSLALAYATVLHFFTFILLTCVPAAVCFVVQSSAQSAAAKK